MNQNKYFRIYCPKLEVISLLEINNLPISSRPKEREHFEDLSLDGRIILKCTTNE